MKIIPKFNGTVENGRLQLNDLKRYQSYLKGLHGEITIIVEPRTRLRSLPQNRLYWTYLQIISNETGNEVETMHELFKDKFIPSEKLHIFGLEVKKYKTTTQLSPLEFSNYIKSIEILTGILCPNKEELL